MASDDASVLAGEAAAAAAATMHVRTVDIDHCEPQLRAVLTRSSFQRNFEHRFDYPPLIASDPFLPPTALASAAGNAILVVATRGVFHGDPPLHIQLESKSLAIVEQATKEMRRLADGTNANFYESCLPVESFLGAGAPTVASSSLEAGDGDVSIVETAGGIHPGFRLALRILGPGGSFLKYIGRETGTLVRIRGRGSSSHILGEDRLPDEDQRPMWLSIGASSERGLREARILCLDLLKVLKKELAEFRERGRRMRNDRRPFGGSGSGSGHYDAQQQDPRRDPYRRHQQQEQQQHRRSSFYGQYPSREQQQQQQQQQQREMWPVDAIRFQSTAPHLPPALSAPLAALSQMSSLMPLPPPLPPPPPPPAISQDAPASATIAAPYFSPSAAAVAAAGSEAMDALQPPVFKRPRHDHSFTRPQ